MRTALRKIGNSRGVIIPAALLELCQLGDEVELSVQGKTLVIEAITPPRADWFANYRPDAPDTDAWATLPTDADNDEWQW